MRRVGVDIGGTFTDVVADDGRVALLATEGHTDVIEISRLSRTSLYHPGVDGSEPPRTASPSLRCPRLARP